MKLRPRIGSPAFTLVEVMVAMVILGLVVAAIYASWYAIIKGSRAAQVAATEVQRLRIAMETVEQAFVGVRMFTGNPDLYAFEVEADGNYTSLSFAAKLPRSFPRSGRYGDFDVRRVTFTVESSNGRENELVLRQTPLLMDPDPDDEQFPLVLARDVTAFSVEFWDTNKFKWLDEWKQTNQLPKLVRVTLGVGHADNYRSEPREYVTRVVAVPASAVPQAMQLPRGGPLVQPGGPGRPGQPGQPGAQPLPPGVQPAQPTVPQRPPRGIQLR
jgi:type II secretion system protein J